MEQKSYISVALEVKAVDDTGSFEGYGSVFGTLDSYRDVVEKGAFKKSLSAWKKKGRMPAMLWQHDSREPIGVFDEMREDNHGLFVKGRLFVDEIPRAKAAHKLLQENALGGMSIGYITRTDEYDRTKNVRKLTELELLEVSLVTFPANTDAVVTSVKELDVKNLSTEDVLKLKEAADVLESILIEREPESDVIPALKQLEKSLRDAGLSRRKAKAFTSEGAKVLENDCEDQAQDTELKSLLSETLTLLRGKSND